MRLTTVALLDCRFPGYRNALEVHARKRVSYEDAEDLVCVCYQQARKSLECYQPGRSLYAWLSGILDNLILQYFQRARTHREDLLAGDSECFESADEQAGRTANRDAQRRRLYRRIATVRLTDRQRDCLLRILAGDTQQQVGDSLRISQRMVSYHLQAAQERLRDPAEYDLAADACDLFYQCAHHPIYRKPHSFDNQSTSVERERRRYTCVREEEEQRKREKMKAKR